ncbi:MAG: hypothetical protein D9V44_09415 [Actinobacteria bacterium]|nr:MAG: hypothetical protein D9V44_09415 [Actinomycetota bacterium]
MPDDSRLGGTGEFLSSSTARSIDWPKPAGSPVAIDTVEVLFGEGDRPLEVAVAASVCAPRADDVRKLWKLRANRGAPVLLVVLHPAGGDVQASVIGTEGDPSPIQGLTRARVERIAAAALDEPNRHQAIRTLDRLLGTVSREGLTAGVINAGLFAAHELRDGVPRRSDWEAARGRSFPLLNTTGRNLLDALGYRIEPKGANLLALSDADTRQAIAVVLEEVESFDRTSSRFGGVSPVSRALAQAQHERLPWVIALRRNQVRLYPADPDVGVGRRGLTETYIELDLTLLDDSDAGYLALLFSPEALAKGGSVDEILHNSGVYATDLGARLRGRIYEDVVPDLAVAVARRMGATTEAELGSAYHRTLIILFRLLFVAYAEDRGLLPFERNPRYTRNALKTYAKDFAEDPAQVFSADSTSIWEDLVQVWNAIDSGEPRWDVPAYNGGLFATDATHPDGAAVSALGLNNLEIGPALMAMLVDADAQAERGPVDFRSLSVREFGTIYEGLLESSLSFARADLTLDRERTYVPAKDGDTVVVEVGGVYFHNASGQRKSTGSYFTKSFAVEHLLDTALEPAIAQHLAQVEVLIDADETRTKAAEKFFDFRVADLAMGSGHFLVAAIDRIEARFSAFISENPLPAVADELARLESVAREALGEEQGLLAEIEPSLLLRRQIARRCIYGLDINLIAVELARLAIWIHTFVPGLPMSSLDHGLVHANSLTGMGTIEETLAALDPQAQPGQFSLFSASVQDALERSRDTLQKVARASEATKQEVRDADQERLRALADAEDARLLMDAAVAARLGLVPIPVGPEEAIESISADTDAAIGARDTLAVLRPAHFPFLFPEVFLREEPGFDVILGNPPWEELVYEEIKFWVLRNPGLRSLAAAERDARIEQLRKTQPDDYAEMLSEQAQANALRGALARGPFPGLESGHADLYKAFCWRFLHLLSRKGVAGVVLPRGALSAAGSSLWRHEVLHEGTFGNIAFLTNNGGWVFEDVHPQYTVALTAFARTSEDRSVSVYGPYSSRGAYSVAQEEPSLYVAADVLASWTDTAAVPALPDSGSGDIFLRMREAPRLDHDDPASWRFVPLQGDFNQTTDKALWIHDEDSRGDLTVYKGGSFDLWQPDLGRPFASATSEDVRAALMSRRGRQVRRADSPFFGLPTSDWKDLPVYSPRIAFRDVSRATDTRTVRAALVPPKTVLTNKAPYLVRLRGSEKDEAYLLGVMCSIPFDWYARTLVEISLNFHILNALPVPRPSAGDSLYERVATIAGRLSCVDRRYEAWASKVGVPVGGVSEESKPQLLAELDACVALLYGLAMPQVEHLVRTFHPTWDCAERLEGITAFYDLWARTTGPTGGA